MGYANINLIKRIFKNETLCYVYEEYVGSDDLTRIRTYIVLDDGFYTKLKIEELGVSSPELKSDLKERGYVPLEDINTLIKKKNY